MKEWGFKPATCGKADFLVADTGMVDRWICSVEGERVVTASMDALLSAGCRGSNRKSGGADHTAPASLFLDVGSNSGFYGLNAISHGCDAVFFDVQPGCNKVVNAALLVNDFGSRGVVMAAGLSDRADVVRAKSSSTCSFDSGRFPISAIESGTLEEGDVEVPVLPLSRLVLSTSPASALTSSTASAAKKPWVPTPQIFMMKIDTEGLEQRVLAGAMPLFKDQAIEHVIVEVTPGFQFWEKNGVTAADVAATMRDIAACGYSFTRLHSKADDDKGRVLTDPKRVHALFLERPFDQEDFLISRT